MSSTQPTRKPPRTRTRARKGPAGATDTRMLASSEQRRSMIAEFAYLRAERRGFRAGDPVADWLESEKEVDALLSRSVD